MSNAPSKPVSFSRPKVGYFSNRPRISRDDEVGFGGEVCLANKENVDTVLMHEELGFVFVLV